MFWPSFNGAMLGPGPQQHRAVMNTYYSLAACCVAAFVVSPLVHKNYKIDMVSLRIVKYGTSHEKRLNFNHWACESST